MPDDKSRPHTTIPPGATPKMSERTLRKTLEVIDQKLDAQATIEAERAGAAKLRTKLFAAFGSLITAGAIAGFAWVWDAQTTNALQDAAIQQVEEDAHEHDPAPPGHTELEAARVATDRRVDGVERATKAINERLDRNEREAGERHRVILEELRRARRAPRTWGGGER